MARVIVQPDQLDLDSPGRRDYWFALEHDSIWGDHLIPLTVSVGSEARSGRGLVAFGANHGNEYEGPVVIKRLLREIRLDDVRGRIILVPVLRECFVVAPFAGHYESLLECGERVRCGDVVGWLHDFDPIDEDPWPARAGVDGIVIAQAWAAPVARGQHIVVVGRTDSL